MFAIIRACPLPRPVLPARGRGAAAPHSQIPAAPRENPIKSTGHFRRYRAYDYSLGASLFLTFNVEPKRDILGRIDPPGVLVHNEWGRLVDAKVGEIAARHAPLRVMSYVIMPNHAHLRVYLPPGIDKPLVRLGAFVSAFKQSTSMLLQHRGRPGPLWQELYHDFLCVTAETIDTADEYIANNPLKRWLLEAPDKPMRVVEPLSSTRLPPDIWWAAAGAVELVAPDSKIASFRVSRSVPQSRFGTVVECAIRALNQGFAIASTFISPGERALLDALAATPGARMVKAGHKILGLVHRPTGREPQLFADRRYLLLSRQSEPGRSRRQGWLDLNDNLAHLADKAVYARMEGGRLRW